jgi:L-aminopeptidase/D-esterase-like protein
MDSKKVSIAQISGISVGHWTDEKAAKGCTVVLCPEGAIASVDQRGGAPATRETDLMRMGTLVERVHAISLSGGSAYGLDAATGVMRWLEENGHGFPVTTGVVPIVPAACIYDLGVGEGNKRPGADAGYAACRAAKTGAIEEGSVGAGAGATVGKALGIEQAIKGGIGTAMEVAASGIMVGALVVVNCWGEVVDPSSGGVVAGPCGEKQGSYVSSIEVLREKPPLSPFSADNSTIGVVATDAVLTKEGAYRLAVIAQTGLARTIRPVHTPVDGDIIFALATCKNEAATDVLQLGALAALAVERACLRAVQQAKSLGGVPTAAEWAGR